MGGALAPRMALANVPTAFTYDLSPPMDSREKFVQWGVAQRGEDPKYLGERFDRYVALVRNEDVWDNRHKRAFLMTPREKFVLQQNLGRAYDHAFLDIGWGVTISGPHIVGRMTSTIDPKKGEKVLEIGTGSGYQSAYLSHLTYNVYTIEIIKPLAERTRATYDALIAAGYNEFKSISTKNADGYYGWEEVAPFDKIIVTCGIDHVPPPLLQQLKPGGIMVIPGRAARRATRAQGGEDAGRGRLDHGRALGYLRRQDRSLRPLHQARRRRDQGHAQQLSLEPSAGSARPNP